MHTCTYQQQCWNSDEYLRKLPRFTLCPDAMDDGRETLFRVLDETVDGDKQPLDHTAEQQRDDQSNLRVTHCAGRHQF